MDRNRLEIKNQAGEKLVCVEVRKPGLSKHPIVILCHGFAYFKEEDGIFTETANRLAKKGYTVYYFDFSGCGESEGDYSKTTLTKLVGDLKSIYKAVTSFEYNDASNVSLMSHSFGSNVIIAAQIPNLKKIVLSGSFYNPHKIISDIFPDFNEHGTSTRIGSESGYTAIGPSFWTDLKRYDLVQLIRNFNCPILFVHGEKDDIVPIENMKPLLDAAKHPAQPVILHKSNHDLRPERELALAEIEKFF